MNIKGVELLVKQLQALGFKLPEHVTEAPEVDPAMLRARSVCPNCGKHGQVAKTFGVRNMGNGVIRPQSWCRDCRKDPKRPEAKEYHRNLKKNRH